jgi:hypothetical protein
MRTLHLPLDRPELAEQRREIPRHQLGVAELTILGTMKVAGDLRVRRPTRQQVVELVRIRVIVRVLTWSARDSEGIQYFASTAARRLDCRDVDLCHPHALS